MGHVGEKYLVRAHGVHTICGSSLPPAPDRHQAPDRSSEIGNHVFKWRGGFGCIFWRLLGGQVGKTVDLVPTGDRRRTMTQDFSPYASSGVGKLQ